VFVRPPVSLGCQSQLRCKCFLGNLSQANVKRNDKNFVAGNQENTSGDDIRFPDSYRTLRRNMINFFRLIIPSTMGGGHLATKRFVVILKGIQDKRFR
jgi:hypothetical protein